MTDDCHRAKGANMSGGVWKHTHRQRHYGTSSLFHAVTVRELQEEKQAKKFPLILSVIIIQRVAAEKRHSHSRL